jgi:hypothetical protein
MNEIQEKNIRDLEEIKRNNILIVEDLKTQDINNHKLSQDIKAQNEELKINNKKLQEKLTDKEREIN